MEITGIRPAQGFQSRSSVAGSARSLCMTCCSSPVVDWNTNQSLCAQLLRVQSRHGRIWAPESVPTRQNIVFCPRQKSERATELTLCLENIQLKAFTFPHPDSSHSAATDHQFLPKNISLSLFFKTNINSLFQGLDFITIISACRSLHVY